MEQREHRNGGGRETRRRDAGREHGGGKGVAPQPAGEGDPRNSDMAMEMESDEDAEWRHRESMEAAKASRTHSFALTAHGEARLTI